MHGLHRDKNHYGHGGRMPIIKEIQNQFPGVYVKPLPIFQNFSSQSHSMSRQVEAIAKAIAADEKLSDGFNFYGESQGALLARAYVTEYNDPPVYNLVALNGPQVGVGAVPKIALDSRLQRLFRDAVDDFDIYSFPFCSVCGYFKGKDKQSYMKHNRWLAYINNEKSINETRRSNMLSLNRYVVTVALNDTTVQPPWSAWHEYWPWNATAKDRIANHSKTSLKLWKRDDIGLKTLVNEGRMIFNAFNSSHTNYTMPWWRKNILPYLGDVRQSIKLK
eukprot:g1552.t1